VPNAAFWRSIFVVQFFPLVLWFSLPLAVHNVNEFGHYFNYRVSFFTLYYDVFISLVYSALFVAHNFLACLPLHMAIDCAPLVCIRSSIFYPSNAVLSRGMLLDWTNPPWHIWLFIVTLMHLSVNCSWHHRHCPHIRWTHQLQDPNGTLEDLVMVVVV